MLDFHRLHPQLSDFSAYRVDEDRRLAAQLDLALDALNDCAPGWEALRDRVEHERPRALTAGLREPPDGCSDGPERPTPITVVATDGSQIYPDRHVEPTCYLLNVSRIAFHYGTEEPPLMAAEPALRYRRRDLAELAPEEGEEALFDITTEVVSALRDEQELYWLLHTALAERQSARPLLAVADGTLIRWMLRGMKHRQLEDRLLSRYLTLLDGFREAGVPVCSYVSRPGNTELINLLRFHRRETDQTPEEESLRGLLDRLVLERTLEVGQRSAVFESRSHVNLEAYGAHRICYFYVRLPEEVARVELPVWVAEQPGWVETIHAVVLDECRKGGGYPMILTEAHERAVIRQQEKALFYRILEREMQGAGVRRVTTSQKAASKRAPRI
ncbi:MAG: DNA double-strand break repair nuclease NurA [Rhodothermales bacterium]|nr:DNA double-strand break repair nuclease NurA [Rhodothermales bacterium]